MFSANSSQVSDSKLFVEDVFSTTIYTGTGSFRALDVGVKDLATFGAMCWFKDRSAAENNKIFDTARAGFGGGGTFPCSPLLSTNLADFDNSGPSVTFYSTGSTITMGSGNPNGLSNYAVWTFRKAPKFFDVVTYNGDSVAGRQIPHNLGVEPGCIIVKSTSSADPWWVYHRSTGNTGVMILNSNSEFVAPLVTAWNNTSPTSTVFTVGNAGQVNQSGQTYVAYLFAHDPTADGFIQCGSFTTNNTDASATVNLGWEPQWILTKATNAIRVWALNDNMRGWATGSSISTADDATFFPNLNNAEQTQGRGHPTPTGFVYVDQASTNYIYIAIRRGPMRTPTSGTSVFSPNLYTQPTGTQITTGFPVDFEMYRNPGSGMSTFTVDRLRGVNTTNSTVASRYLYTASTAAEASSTGVTQGWNNTGFQVASGNNNFQIISWAFRRAPSFFDVVCYTGTGSLQNVNHNLGVAPELIIVKRRNTSGDGNVYAAPTGPLAIGSLFSNPAGGFPGSIAFLTGDDGSWGGVTPTSTVFTVNRYTNVNASGSTYIAYLFASCPGVSKVGSYTGNGSSQTINCGFTTGARFVMIKRSNGTGDWYVWDTARGIVSGNDPHLSLNTTDAEVTTDDSVDTDSSGFVVNQLSATNINVSSATYIYLAVA